tara:strand:- start:446 stop:1033 length:588 start_codon:yes stop_codon:yes gene_type:complete
MINTKTNNKSIWQDIKNIIIWIIIAFLIRWQILEPRWIPSGSMLPTLQIQDKILIEKYTPKLNKILGKHFSSNQIVVFSPPEKLNDFGYTSNTALIKRVIATEGDSVEVKGGQLFVNNKRINEPWISRPINYEMDKIIIPKQSLWVLGDNRNNSLDSHVWGYLPEENVIGIAFWRYWPFKTFGPIWFDSYNKIEK